MVEDVTVPVHEAPWYIKFLYVMAAAFEFLPTVVAAWAIESHTWPALIMAAILQFAGRTKPLCEDPLCFIHNP